MVFIPSVINETLFHKSDSVTVNRDNPRGLLLSNIIISLHTMWLAAAHRGQCGDMRAHTRTCTHTHAHACTCSCSTAQRWFERRGRMAPILFSRSPEVPRYFNVSHLTSAMRVWLPEMTAPRSRSVSWVTPPDCVWHVFKCDRWVDPWRYLGFLFRLPLWLQRSLDQCNYESPWSGGLVLFCGLRGFELFKKSYCVSIWRPLLCEPTGSYRYGLDRVF